MATLTTDEILDAIANMTVLELSELLKSFEEPRPLLVREPRRGSRTPRPDRHPA
jgi:ribosomal protein L7/L12